MLRLYGGLCVLEVGSFPGVEAAGKVGDLAETGAAQDAGCDGAAIAALAVHDDEFAGVDFAGAVDELTHRNAAGVFERGFDFAVFADIEDGDVVVFFFFELGWSEQGTCRM